MVESSGRPPIPVAVVGAGSFGKKHVERWATQSRAALVAVVDPDVRCREIARRYGAAWFRSVDDLPAGLVQAATVAVPWTAQYEVATALLRARIDVLVEKPLALHLREADALIALARSLRRVLQVGHVERFNPAVLAIHAGPSAFSFHAFRRGPAPHHGHHRDLVLDLMIHDIELVVHWIGAMPTVVTARGEADSSAEVDRVEATLRFPRGQRAVLVAERGEPLRTVVIESRAQVLHIDLLARRARDGVIALPVTERDALGAQFEAFLSAVEHRGETVVPGEQGRAALEIALRVRRELVVRARPPFAAAGSYPAA